MAPWELSGKYVFGNDGLCCKSSSITYDEKLGCSLWNASENIYKEALSRHWSRFDFVVWFLYLICTQLCCYIVELEILINSPSSNIMLLFHTVMDMMSSATLEDLIVSAMLMTYSWNSLVFGLSCCLFPMWLLTQGVPNSDIGVNESGSWSSYDVSSLVLIYSRDFAWSPHQPQSSTEPTQHSLPWMKLPEVS